MRLNKLLASTIVSFLSALSIFCFANSSNFTNISSDINQTQSFFNRQIRSSEAAKCTGDEKIVLTGKINGTSVSQTYSDYQCHYDKNRQLYFISVNLTKGDFFTFYLHSRDTYLSYPENNDYGEKTLSYARITKYYSIGMPHYCVYYTGTYEFYIDGSIEFLENVADVWSEEMKSSVKLLGNNILSTFVFIEDKNYRSLTISTRGSNPSILQYGEKGIESDFVVGCKLFINNKYYLLIDVKYNPDFSNCFALIAALDEGFISFENELLPNRVYFFNDSVSKEYGDACQLAIKIINQIGIQNVSDEKCLNIRSITKDVYSNIKATSDRLDYNNKTFFNNFYFTVHDEKAIEVLSSKSLFTTLESILSFSPEVSQTIILFVGFFTSTTFIFIFLLALKARRTIKRM